MKKLFYLIVVIIVCAVACTSEEMVPTERVRTHGESRLIVKNNHVSLDNVMTLTGVMRKATRAAVGEEDDDFICIVDTDNDTLFYVVNHPEGGWTMYASDKRVPAIVAEDSIHRFNSQILSDIAGNWFEAMKEDMKNVKSASDKELNFSEEEIETNRNYWNVTKRILDSTQRGHEPNPGILIPAGHYELYSVSTYTQVYKYRHHLTQTTWHQHYPYNYYCPRKTVIDNPDDPNTPAGCVAIAGAQMLYYLHYKIGAPDSIPDAAYCNANAGDLYPDMQQWCTGANTWALMPYHGNDASDAIYAAPLIANVGTLLYTDYLNNGSSAHTDYLVDFVFSPYGISCYYDDSFNVDSLYESLMDSIPVIADASRNMSYQQDHCFIIDGYKVQRNVTEYVYKWVLDFPYNGSGILPIMKADSIVRTFSTPTLSYIKMNWGWESDDANDIWFVPTGDWLTNKGGFNYHRHMIYRFRRIEE